MQKHRGDESPPFVSLDKIRPWDAHAKPDLRYAAQSPQDAQPAAPSGSRDGHPAHAQHQDIGNQKRGSHRRFVLAEDAGKFLAERREREAQVGAAHMTPRGANADERAARRADLRSRLVASASCKKSPYRTLPAPQPPLPLIGKRQFSSLRVTHRVPIIQNSQLFTRNEEP